MCTGARELTPAVPRLSVPAIAWLASLFFAAVAHAGGQSIHNAPPSKVADYVKARGGHTVITKVSPLPSLHAALLLLLLLRRSCCNAAVPNPAVIG